MLGNHGLYLKGPTPYEDLLRVALVARGPGVAANQAASKPMSILNLAATFYDSAGVAAPQPLQSRSLGWLRAEAIREPLAELIGMG